MRKVPQLPVALIAPTAVLARRDADSVLGEAQHKIRRSAGPTCAQRRAPGSPRRHTSEASPRSAGVAVSPPRRSAVK
jgi:hypothetical protein